ncbi:MAG: hypothetical protein E6J87_06100, partial [Deltaproteobacteria bacterium]
MSTASTLLGSIFGPFGESHHAIANSAISANRTRRSLFIFPPDGLRSPLFLGGSRFARLRLAARPLRGLAGCAKLAPAQCAIQAGKRRLSSASMAKEVYVAAVGLTKVDLTGRIFGSIFDLFSDAYARALEDSSVRSFDAVQVGVMDSEEFENRANIATVVVDRLGLTGIPAVRSETASSTGASALHEAYYKIASGEAESVLVLGGERMKTVNTEVATAILSKSVDPEERRFGFTMPALIALITQAWFRELGLDEEAGAQVLARLMHRAHALGAHNPLAAFYARPEPLSAYFDPRANLPVATPLR